MKKSVLIVDDNYICVEGISTSVNWASLGINTIHKAYDGATALEIIKYQPVDLIISDVSMPGLSGLELAEHVLSINPAIKIILVSAYDKFEYAKKAIRLGAYDYVEKPIDYEYLQEILGNVLLEIEKEQKNRQLLKDSLPALQEQFFRSLLQQNRKESPETVKLYQTYLDLNSDCRYYTTLQISAEDSISLKQVIGIEEYYIRFMSFEHSIRNAVSVFPMHYILKDLTGFTCILGDNTGTRSEFKQKILSIFTQITELYQERFEFFTGLGKIVSSMTDLPASYAQARKAMEYRFIFPSQNILEVNALPGFDPKFILNQESEEDKLMELICRNDLESIREWVISFANSIQENLISREMVHLKLYSIAVRILKFSCEINISNDHLKQDILSVFSHTRQYRNIDEIAQWLLDICFSVCSCLQDSVTSYHSGLCESAIAYIRQNYADSNLNLNAIAEYVQITPAYLSTLFKKYCNQNISNFITDVRIDMACLLLRTTSDSLKSISLQVGYSNQYYFSSCFKKKMGVTPTAYREQQE